MPYIVTVVFPNPANSFTRTRSSKAGADTMAAECRARYKGALVTVTEVPATPTPTKR